MLAFAKCCPEGECQENRPDFFESHGSKIRRVKKSGRNEGLMAPKIIHDLKEELWFQSKI